MNQVLRRENEALLAQNGQLREQLAEIATALERLTRRRRRRSDG